MIDLLLGGVKPNVEAERSVIGAVLLDADRVMPECEEILSSDDFLVGEYRTLYRTMSGYFVDGKPIDVVTLIAQHGNEYKQIITEAALSMPSIANWKEYARIVLGTAKKRRAFELMQGLVEALLSPGLSVPDCQELAVGVCEQLSTTKGDNTVSAKEGFLKFYSSLQKPAEYIRTGFDRLDKHTFIRRGDFVVIGARPSVGKTALTLQMLLTISQTLKVVYFSLETRAENLFGRMSANLGNFGMSAIKTQSVDFSRLAQMGKIFNELDFHVVEAAGWTVAQIKAKAVQLGADVIFVDYMGLVKSDGKSRYEKITNISVDLHTLAQRSNMTVFGISQLNREGRGEPTMEALRESGQIEQDADVVLLIHAPDGLEEQPELNGSPRKIIIAKNKEGQVGSVDLIFDGTVQRFLALEGRY